MNLLEEEIFKNHDVALLTGGSMMYIDAVCKGIDDIPTVRDDIRTWMKQRLKDEGLEALVEELIDAGNGQIQAKGRTVFQAPEVDGNVYIDNPGDVKPGDFIHVRITDGYAYDLIAERIK